MTEVVAVLDRDVASRRWADQVRCSLRDDTDAWLRAVDRHEVTKDRAWVLLAWVEQAASSVVGSRSAELVEASAFATCLLEDGPLDARDVLVVASLVRRAADLAGLDFATLVRAGCGRAGERGRRCLDRLLRVSDRTPATHVEVGAGKHFRFERVPSGAAEPAVDGYRLAAARREPDVPPWPKTIRYLLLLGLVAVAGVGLVVLLYIDGFLPLAGPFVAIIVGPLLVLAGRHWRSRKVARLPGVLVESLRRTRLELDRERVRAPAARTTSAADDSLEAAITAVETALRHFTAGRDTAGTTTVAELAQQISRTWTRGAPLTREIRAAAKSARRLATALRRTS